MGAGPAQPFAGASVTNPSMPPSRLPPSDPTARICNTMSISAGRQVNQLVFTFCAWKALLLLLAAFCPGPGYDTSSFILLDTSVQRHEHFHTVSRFNRFILNLFRWDALYFVKAAERGQVHEQAWAFSGVYSHLLRLTGQRE